LLILRADVRRPIFNDDLNRWLLVLGSMTRRPKASEISLDLNVLEDVQPKTSGLVRGLFFYT
jgi:hypothetical protein